MKLATVLSFIAIMVSMNSYATEVEHKSKTVEITKSRLGPRNEWTGERRMETYRGLVRIEYVEEIKTEDAVTFTGVRWGETSLGLGYFGNNFTNHQYLKTFCHAYLPGSSLEDLETERIRQADGLSIKVKYDSELSSSLIYTLYSGMSNRGDMYVKFSAITSFTCAK